MRKMDMPSSSPLISELPLDLRDKLALERTHLANERTVLAYVRTGMALVVAGFSLINFFRDYLYVWVGVVFVPVGIGITVAGWFRYRAKRVRIKNYLHTPSA
ncbi:DUF202 domain-containing protein [Hymenobacter mucosus]|uniref:Putative membrane protein n=1 Tax=Hymenobacter mucosus TaxID=1411120 RepID=A0A238Y7C9_9BACT|nr:DUF202 domain-containing protein [Hymenobacter mucosus]SNR67007.1 putative membrane protein [Hymenobacter mucosus]